jgi:hypothetical protein
MRYDSRALTFVCSLIIVVTASLGADTSVRASSTRVKLPDGKTYEVKVKGGKPVQFSSSEIEVSDLALTAAVKAEGDASLPFSWLIFAQVLAQGNFVVKVTTPLDESASTSFEFTGPGKLTQSLFDCVDYPKVCAGLEQPGTHWFLFHFSFEPRGGGKGFELDQWARMDHLQIEETRKLVAQAKGEWGGTVAPTAESKPKATVYVYRQGVFFGCGLRPSIWCDEVRLARISCGKYFIAEVDPGLHTFRSDDETSRVSLEFEAGKTYFLRADIEPDAERPRGRRVLYKMNDTQGSLAVQSLLPLARKSIQDHTMVLTE